MEDRRAFFACPTTAVLPDLANASRRGKRPNGCANPVSWGASQLFVFAQLIPPG
jgi:hypothetical protein